MKLYRKLLETIMGNMPDIIDNIRAYQRKPDSVNPVSFLPPVYRVGNRKLFKDNIMFLMGGKIIEATTKKIEQLNTESPERFKIATIDRKITL